MAAEPRTRDRSVNTRPDESDTLGARRQNLLLEIGVASVVRIEAVRRHARQTSASRSRTPSKYRTPSSPIVEMDCRAL